MRNGSEVTNLLQHAREAYARHDWDDAYQRFNAARDDGELHVDDLAALADTAWWLGRTDESLAWSERGLPAPPPR